MDESRRSSEALRVSIREVTQWTVLNAEPEDWQGSVLTVETLFANYVNADLRSWKSGVRRLCSCYAAVPVPLGICWTVNRMYSCAGSKFKESLASLCWSAAAKALHDPALIVTLAKFRWEFVPQRIAIRIVQSLAHLHRKVDFG
jgi:hypothetical protein